MKDNKGNDVDLKMFYCLSRYYDPLIGRFITADSLDYLDPSSINGLNLFWYCGNNPVMFSLSGNGNFGDGTNSSSSSAASGGGIRTSGAIQNLIGAIPDILTGAKYLSATEIHNKFAYSTNTRYYFPILGNTWRWTGKTGSSLKDLGNLTNGSFRQILTGNAKATWGAMAKSFGKTAALTGVINLGFNLMENGFDFTDGAMWLDTGIDTAIGLGAYGLAAGTMSLATAGLALAGLAIPGVAVVGGMILLSIGFEWLIREMTGYKQ